MRNAGQRIALPLVSTLLLASCAPAVSRAPLEPTGPWTETEASRRWVEETLASLTLREKAGQLIMPWVSGEYTALDSPEFEALGEWVERDGVGGLVVSVGMPHSYAAKLNALQERARVPLLVGSDMENGPGMRMGGIYSFPHLLHQGGGTVFPPLMALGATGADSLAYELGRVLGREARAVGVHVVFGPILDVNSNPLNPIINTRSFGEDPALVSRLATAYIRGTEEAGLMTTGKHFPGHGDTEVDSHIELPYIRADREGMDAIELPPFRTAVEAGVEGIMTAHVAVPGVEGPDARPATLSPYFMSEVLRGEMGFRGLLFTDAMTMGGVAEQYGATEPLILALEAGADVLLMPRDVPEAITTIVAAVESGRISEARIDDSVRRILQAKATALLHEERQVDLTAVDRSVGVRAHTALAEHIAARSITLVRDREDLIPVANETRRILSITYASPSDAIAGRAFNGALNEGGLELDEVRVDARTPPSELEELNSRARRADLVLVSAYVSPLENAGTIGAAEAFSGFVDELATDGVPVAVVSFGSPYLLSEFPSVSAYLIAWGGAEVSQRAAARALRGEAPITGTLPISLPPEHAAGDGILP